ncbi:phenylalanine--tRNA ligase subunit beta [Candidatus Micrarchaeota archaeon]|nr:phenylalanine--tRNA ligase subunit beta [Candidatus Micrarchaeota archaeon]
MVSVTVKKAYLLGLLNKKVRDAELEEALFQVKAGSDDVSGEELSLEVTGDRPDLLSAEGVARALKGYFGVEKGIPSLKLGRSDVSIHVEKEAAAIRPYLVGAVIEHASLSEEDVVDLFQMQEKLDMTHGRKRRKISIGLYDMRILKPPFYFRAFAPDSIHFIPLKSDRKMTLKQILEHHDKGKAYAHLVNAHKKYPCLVDADKEVLSLVPVINGISTSVTAKSNRIFIDHTGSDLPAMNASLNMLCQYFADRGASVKTVDVIYPKHKLTTPNPTPQKMNASIPGINRMLGTDLSSKRMISCLERQRISASVTGTQLHCRIPAYRADFMHPVDLIEEVAMGYGYNAFEVKRPSIFTKGSISETTRLTDSLEDVMIGYGFQQVATYITTKSAQSQKTHSDVPGIRILNPVSEEYSSVRSRLLPNMMDVLSKNTHASYPQKLFEIGEVVVADVSAETKTRNELRLCAVSAHSEAHLTESASVLGAIMQVLDRAFRLERFNQLPFLEGRGATIVESLTGTSRITGRVGELHPRVLESFHIEVPVAVFEVRVK